MSLQTKVVCVCDGCGIEREKDSNHWWILRQGFRDAFWVQAWEENWEENSAAMPNARHFCGMTCAIRAQSDLMLEIVKKEAVKV